MLTVDNLKNMKIVNLAEDFKVIMSDLDGQVNFYRFSTTMINGDWIGKRINSCNSSERFFEKTNKTGAEGIQEIKNGNVEMAKIFIQSMLTDHSKCIIVEYKGDLFLVNMSKATGYNIVNIQEFCQDKQNYEFAYIFNYGKEIWDNVLISSYLEKYNENGFLGGEECLINFIKEEMERERNYNLKEKVQKDKTSIIKEILNTLKLANLICSI